MDKEKAAQEKNWLIKSSSRIIGPYSAIEIAQLLIKKHISIIDEVRQPLGRWAYIRETPIFLEVVTNLRSEQANSSEETASMMSTQTLSRTDLVPANPDMTPTPIMGSHDVTPNTVKEVKDVTPASQPPQAKEPARTFGSTQDQRVQNKIQEKKKQFSLTLWILVFIFGGGILYLALNKARGPTVDVKKLTEQARRYKFLQLYDKALESYKKIQSAREPDAKLSFEMAPLLIHIENQTQLGRRLLQAGISDDNLSRDQKVEAFLGIGISYVIEGDLQTAQDYYQKALGYDPNSFEAHLNMALNEIRKGDLPKATELFKQIPPTATHKSFLVLGKSLLAVETKKNKGNEEIIKSLNEMTVNSHPLRKELLLLFAYVSLIEHNNTQLLSVMRAFVDMPLFQSQEFSLDPKIDSRVADWEHMEKYCSEIFLQAPVTSISKAFRSVCLLEQNRDAEAKRLIDEALVENPKDAYLKLAQTHLLLKSGKFQEALSVLRNPIMMNLRSNLFLQGKACKALSDTKCAEQSFDQAFQQNPNDISYAAEVVASQIQSGKITEARGLIKAGLDTHNNHKPLIELREKLENP